MTTISNFISNNFEKCIFCNHKDSQQVQANIDGRAFLCPNCGYYEITGSLLRSSFSDEDLLNFFHKASAIAAERKLHGQDGFRLTTDNWKEFIADYPKSFIEKMDRTLVNLAYEANFEPIDVTLRNQDFSKLFIDNYDPFSESIPDFEPILSSLKETEMITYASVPDKVSKDKAYFIKLTVSGLKHIVELQKKYKDKYQAFIAMWFNGKTDVFKEATKKAIEAAGYKPEIVSEVHHNEFIMDKVTNLIDGSRFVIADLTSIPENENKSSGVRGGVYYEAGYAKGLGLPVIFTCNNDSHERVHFDLQQMNTILWRQEENGVLKTGNFDYVEYLTEHIIATVGRGPLFNDLQK